jgi:hypothetical protein
VTCDEHGNCKSPQGKAKQRISACACKMADDHCDAVRVYWKADSVERPVSGVPVRVFQHLDRCAQHIHIFVIFC